MNIVGQVCRRISRFVFKNIKNDNKCIFNCYTYVICNPKPKLLSSVHHLGCIVSQFLFVLLKSNPVLCSVFHFCLSIGFCNNVGGTPPTYDPRQSQNSQRFQQSVCSLEDLWLKKYDMYMNRNEKKFPLSYLSFISRLLQVGY